MFHLLLQEHFAHEEINEDNNDFSTEVTQKLQKACNSALSSLQIIQPALSNKRAKNNNQELFLNSP